MNYLKNQRGNAFLITLAIIILFTLLGMAMLSATSSGIKKNVSRQETVQATALSEKGVAQITKQINSELTVELGVNGLSKGSFIEVLE